MLARSSRTFDIVVATCRFREDLGVDFPGHEIKPSRPKAFLEKLELPSLGPTDQEMKTGPSIFLGLSLCPDRTSGKGSRRAALWAWRGRQRDWGPIVGKYVSTVSRQTQHVAARFVPNRPVGIDHATVPASN